MILVFKTFVMNVFLSSFWGGDFKLGHTRTKTCLHYFIELFSSAQMLK